jgi:hypothetical protein
MRPIPQKIIDQIDEILGLKGRPQMSLVRGQWIETGAYEWNRFPGPGLLWKGISLELRQAIADTYQEIDCTKSPLPSEADFLNHLQSVNPSVVEEYVTLQKALHEADKRFTSPMEVMQPKLSDELSVALNEITQQVMNQFEGNEFDIDKFHKHVRLLTQNLPENLKAEIEELRPSHEELESTPEIFAKERQSRLAKVNKVLKGTSFIAYGDVIVARMKNQFDILRREQTNGANYGISTEALIKELKVLDKKYGIEIINAGFDSVTFRFKQTPNRSEVDGLEKYLLKLCPNSVGEIPPQFPEGEIMLWWD